MPVNLEDADDCQKCGKNEATEIMSVAIGGVPVGVVFVCEGCADE